MWRPSDFARTHPRAFLALLLPLVALALWRSLAIEVDNSLEVWRIEGTSATRTYERFLETFGSEEFVLVAVEREEGRDIAPALERTARAIEALDGITRVDSLHRMARALSLPPRLLELPGSAARGFLISADGRTLALVAQVDPRATERPRLVSEIRRIVEEEREFSGRVALGGPPVLNAELDALSQRDPRILVPTALTLCAALLFLLLRRGKLVVIAVSVSLVAVLFALALTASWLGDLNLVTVAFPTLLWVLCTSQTLHFLYALRAADEPSLRVERALGRVKRPLAFMSLTTTLGFSSLALSPIAPVRHLGLAMAFGILIAWFLNVTATPAAVSLLRAEPSEKTFRARRFFLWVSEATRRRRTLWCLFALLALLCLLPIPSIGIESNALTFLPEDDRVVQDYEYVQEHLTGLVPIEVHCTVEPGEDPEEALRRFGVRARQHANVTYVFSAADLPDARTTEDPSLAALRERYVSSDGRHHRVSLLTTAMEGDAFLETLTWSRELAEEVLPGEVHVTGIVALLVQMQEALFRSQLTCLAGALLLVAAVMGILTRNLRRTLLVMIPNLFPVVLLFGTMGALGFDLDVATVMVASIALGIAVDNTIHVVTRHGELQGTSCESRSWPRIHRELGPPIAATSLVASVGFLTFLASSFRPMFDFGVLTTVALIAAALCDLLLLPALLRRRAP